MALSQRNKKLSMAYKHGTRFLKLSGEKKNIARSFYERGGRGFGEAYNLAYKNESKEVTPLHIFTRFCISQKVGGVFIRLGVPAQALQTRLSKFLSKPDSEWCQ